MGINYIIILNKKKGLKHKRGVCLDSMDQVNSRCMFSAVSFYSDFTSCLFCDRKVKCIHLIFTQSYNCDFKFKSKQIRVACENSRPSSLLAQVALRRTTVFAGQDTGSQNPCCTFYCQEVKLSPSD